MKKPKHKLRILVNTNAPWATSGYSQQAKQFIPLMHKEGYEVACVAFYGLQGGAIKLDGVTYFPNGGDQWGDQSVVNHQQIFKPDIVITLQDIWTLNPDLIRQFNRFIPIVPIDHEPIPPAIYERLKLAYRIISYAPFGERELTRVGMHSTYIPHTVDTNLFVKSNKSETRKKIGIPDDVFLFGMVAANKDNPPRKSFQEVLDAFKIFKQRHPKSAIYFHSIMNQPGGFPIDTYSRALGIQDSVYFIGAYDLLNRVDTEDMPKIYSAFDCFLLPSTNEGFGVPAIEAQSCEIPVIVNDFTALRDLVIDGVTGYKTKVASKRFTPLNSYIGIPDVNSIVEKMEKVYKTDRDAMGKAGRKFVQENFDIRVVWEKHWLPFLDRVEKEIYKN